MNAVFPFGIAAGDSSTDGAVLWTKVSRPGAAVTWTVEDEESDGVRGVATADETGTVRVHVRNLRPGTRWSYQFSSHDRRSPQGRFRTLPVDGRPLRLGVVSCAKFNAGYFNAYARVAERDDLDLVLHLGDYIYEAANHPPPSQTASVDIGRPFEPGHECRSREDYERRYAQYRSDPDVQALHASHAMINTIDDHELADNAWADGAQEHREQEHGPWRRRRDAALAAWRAWLPTSASPEDGLPIWRAVDLGSLGRLLLLETRTARLPTAQVGAEDATMLGAEQRAWLQNQIDDAGQGWLVVAVPSMLTSLSAGAADKDATLALQALKLLDPDGAPFHDRWDAYPREREQILGRLGSATSHPLVLSGDVHVAADSQLAVAGRAVTEWTTTSVTSQNLDDKLGWEPRTRSRLYEERLVHEVEALSWCDVDSHGFMVVTLTSSTATCEWWAVETVRERSEHAMCVHTSALTRDARYEAGAP